MSCAGWAGWGAGGLIVLARVEDQSRRSSPVAAWMTRMWQVVDEQQDVGSGEGSADGGAVSRRRAWAERAVGEQERR